MELKGPVLIVDDDHDLRASYADMLHLWGYECVGVIDGAAALATLRGSAGARRPRLILLDLMMPGMNGWAFRAAQLADPAIADIPVVVISAVEHPSCESLKADEVLSKLAQFDELLRVVKRYCG